MRGARKGISSIWYTLLMDGTLYFMVIFTSHIIYTFTLILARVSDLVLIAVCCDSLRRIFDLFVGLQPLVQLIPAM